jgi:hypothetical protein
MWALLFLRFLGGETANRRLCAFHTFKFQKDKDKANKEIF